MITRVDRRIRHFTHDNVDKLLDRKSIAHVSIPLRDRVVMYAHPGLPTERQLVAALSFSYSAKLACFYRVWRAGE